jgi:hypothetical protein
MTTVQTQAITTKMNIKVNDQTLEFKIIPLTFVAKDITSIFYDKNNKTLEQTFEHHKYSRLKFLLADKYKNYLNNKLGGFLKSLKEANDNNYLCFLKGGSIN